MSEKTDRMSLKKEPAGSTPLQFRVDRSLIDPDLTGYETVEITEPVADPRSDVSMVVDDIVKKDAFDNNNYLKSEQGSETAPDAEKGPDSTDIVAWAGEDYDFRKLFLKVARKRIEEHEMSAIVDILHIKAKNGNLGAIRLLFEYLGMKPETKSTGPIDARTIHLTIPTPPKNELNGS